MRRLLMTLMAAMMAAMSAHAQMIKVVDTNGNGIPMVRVMTEDGVYIGNTDLNGVLADVKGAAKVTVAHVAYKPQLVNVADLPPLEGIEGMGEPSAHPLGERRGLCITMEDVGYDLAEIVVKPKPYIYVEVFYRVYVYRNDSLCYFLSGIMPNAYDFQKKKLEHGSYYQSKSEFCKKMGAAITWGARTQEHHVGQTATRSLKNMEALLEKVYFVKATADGPNHKTYSNPQGKVGELVYASNQIRMTLDGGLTQMYANKVKGQKKLLEKRQNKDYKYQYTLIYAENHEKDYDVTSFLMESDHWEFNDKKGHVKFFVENYATDHYYMDKLEWKAKKKSMKQNYSRTMTLDQLDAYATSYNIPALSPATRQAIGKLKQW